MEFADSICSIELRTCLSVGLIGKIRIDSSLI